MFLTQNVPLDTQNAVLRNRSKFFSRGSKKVSLQVMSLLIPTSRIELIWTPRKFFWQPGWKLCCHKSKSFMLQVRNNWKLTKLSKKFFIFKMILWRHRVHFSILISLPENFSRSTLNVRSNLWKFWKKEKTFKNLIFWLILWDEDCNFQFW